MRMQLLKIVVVLLVAGSGDTRPQSGADSATRTETSETSSEGWRGVRASNKSHDIVRDDSRYTGTSGSNRKSYITYFRDSVDSSREYNAPVSRASGFAPSETAQPSLGTRRSKIDDVWTTPEFKATASARSNFSRTDVLGEIARIGAIRDSSEAGGSSFRSLSSDTKTIRDQQTGWIRSVLASSGNSDSGIGRTDYSEKVNTGNLEGWKPIATPNRNFESTLAQTKYSSAGNDFLASHASGFARMNENISIATKNRQGSIRSDSSSNKDIDKNNVWRRKIGQGSNIFPSHMARTNAPSNFQEGIATHIIRKNHDSIRKSTDGIDSLVTSYENLQPGVVIDPFRHVDAIRCDGLNNSKKSSSCGAGTRPTLIPNSKSDVVGHNRSSSRRDTITSNRNFVKLRYPFSASNRRNVSHVILNTQLANNDDVRVVQLKESSSKNLTRTAAKRPDSNDHATSKPTKSHTSHSQNLPSQTDKVGGGNGTRDEYDATPAQHDAHLKNWPNEALQDIEDLYNYEKYTSSLEEAETNLQDADGAPILSSSGGYFAHPDPILDLSVKKIIHWLKIPAIVPNGTHFANGDVHKPVESVLESIYEDLEPNRPLSVGDNHDGNYETVVFQNAPQSQYFNGVDYHGSHSNRRPNPSSIARPQYATSSSNPSTASTPSSWSDVASLKNKTVHNPLTHVTQNTVVHILNDGLKKPNVTVTQLKVPESDVASVDKVGAPSGSPLETSAGPVQKPNVHVMFTSQKDGDKEPVKQETNTFPSSYNTKCPTILINTYTRVNNTVQSKEGCTDLNIIVNSHVSNTNVFKPSGVPIAEDQQTSLATQSYGGDATDGSDKYAEAIDDLAHQDSLESYVTASTGTYGSSPLETSPPDQNDYYDSQKEPEGIPLGQVNDLVSPDELSTVEVFQGTQISVSGSNIPLTSDGGATAGPVPAGVDAPAGSSVDGPAVDSAVDPPASAPNVPLGSQELPAYLINPGTVMGQSNNALAPGSLQLPSLPSRPNIAIGSGLPSVSSLSQGTSGSLNNDDDDDDDDFEMSPGGLLQSMTSVFTYFTFLNPLGYSFFSLAAAPFAAMAAGVLGVAAVVFPWALPNVFDFGRAADKVTIRFRPNLEEFVRRAVHKYDRLNEWKSKRRKRRR